MIDAVLGAFEAALTFLHDIFVPVFGDNAWGWAIIALTLVVRIALLPLAIKQTRSMRAMQALQPQIKELQKKYKVDRDLLKKDPELYKQRKQKLSQEQMALFQREGANPMASCLPLLAQAPIFLALFYTLRRSDDLPGAPFYFFTNFVADDATASGLAATVSQAGWPGWLLIVLMSGSLFISQKQMMARNAAQMADNPMAQQQKILLYAMPIFLAVISFQFPLGILLYWVTTNIWQVAQQAIILREVKHEVETGTLADKPGGEAAKRTKPGKGKKGKKGPAAAGDGNGSAKDGGRSDGRGKGATSGSGKGATSGSGKGATSGSGNGKGATSGGKKGAGRRPDGSPDGDPSKTAKDAPAASSGTGSEDTGADGAGQGGRGSGKSRKGGPTDGVGHDGTTAGGPDAASGTNDNGAAGSNGRSRSSKRDHIPRRGGSSRG